MKEAALIMIDVQNDFCPGGALAVSHGDKVVPPLNKIKKFFDMYGFDVFQTRCWHPAKTTHFDEWPVHCVRDTWGAKFHPDLDVQVAFTVSKGTEPNENGYSGFEGHMEDFGAVSLRSETLLGMLSPFGVEELYIGGLDTYYCVRATVLDALKKGFKVFLLKDACRAVNLKSSDGKRAIEEMKNAGAVITTTTEVIRKLKNK